MSYNIIDLVVNGNNVYCHKDCNYDFKPLNTLCKSLIPINGNIPSPNYVNQNISKHLKKGINISTHKIILKL